jgi:hypothetical protein
MFYTIYPSAEISHWKWLTTSTTKQCYFTVFKIKHNLYILTISTPLKKWTILGVRLGNYKKALPLVCPSYLYHSLAFLLCNRIQNPLHLDPVPYYSVTIVCVQCRFHLAEQQITGMVYKPEMAKICTRTIHMNFAWPNVFNKTDIPSI